MTLAAPLTPVGHAATLGELRALWAGGRGPRTLLFAGPEGVGRRHAARWLAAYVNCARQAEAPREEPYEVPCLECESCRLMLAGTHPDFKEVSPALTTATGRAKRSLEIRIEQLVPREGGEPEPLGPWLLTRPRYNVRVGVIDHADAMNAPAANSLLKLLEEPPAWALIVLVASGPEAVLPTVASRSSVVRFRPLSEADLVAALPTVDRDHPAFRLGQPGALLSTEAVDAAYGPDVDRAAADELLAALTEDLSATLAAAEAFGAALGGAMSGAASGGPGGPGPLAWLRHGLRAYEPTRYAAALDAVERCEEALAHYAQAPLAATVLALELRRVLA